MNSFIAVVVFIYGIVLGSFFNVVGLRWIQDKSIKGRSACPNCGATLGPLNLIPIVSYAIQGGKCHNCKKKISLIYPVMEITTGLAYLGAYMAFDLTPMFAAQIIFITSMLVSAVTDYKDGYVLDKVVIPPAVVSILILAISDFSGNIMNIGIGIVVMLLLLIPVKMEKLGGGDVVLMGMSFVMFGPMGGTIVMLIASMTTLVFMLLTKNKMVRFIPFWAIGNIAMYFLIYFKVLENLLLI